MSPQTVPLSIIRGGTSRGVVLHTGDVPKSGQERDEFVLNFYSGGIVDGLGGGVATTNKILLVQKSTGAQDLEYIVGNVDSAGTTVDWAGTCGNMTSAVVPFALTEGLIDTQRSSATLLNQATGGRVEVLWKQTSSAADFYRMDLTTKYLSPGGSTLGELFPTGARIDLFSVGNRSVAGTLIDATHPYLFVRYEDVVNGSGCLDLDVAENLRGQAAVRCGVIENGALSSTLTPAVPRIVLIRNVNGNQIDMLAVSMGQIVSSVPVTAAIAAAAALGTSGTLMGEICLADTVVVRGDSSEVKVGLERRNQQVVAVSIERSSRILIRGQSVI